MSLLERLAAVPKKYWIGGAVAVAAILYLRARGRASAAEASQQADGLISALQLPGGLQYAPITGWAGQGAGNNEDSGLPPLSANQLLMLDLASGGGLGGLGGGGGLLGASPYSQSTAPAPASIAPFASAANFSNSPALASRAASFPVPENLSRWAEWGDPGSIARQQAWIDSHPASLTTPGPDNATIFQTLPVPDNLIRFGGWDAFEKQISWINSQPKSDRTPGPYSDAPVSNSEILSFFSSHQNDLLALKEAMIAYNITPDQAKAANVPADVVDRLTTIH